MFDIIIGIIALVLLSWATCYAFISLFIRAPKDLLDAYEKSFKRRTIIKRNGEVLHTFES